MQFDDDGVLIAFLGGPAGPRKKTSRRTKNADLKRKALEMYDQDKVFKNSDIKTRSRSRRIAYRLFPHNPHKADQWDRYIRRWVQERDKPKSPAAVIEEHWTRGEVHWLREPSWLRIDEAERKQLIEVVTRPAVACPPHPTQVAVNALRRG